MLDKLTCITYKIMCIHVVCWNNTLYQVLLVAWANRITTRRYRDS